MTQPMMPPMTANKPSRTLALASGTLLASVLLNLFLVGVVLGIGGHHHGHHRSFGPLALEAPHGEYLVGWMVRYLDPPDAQVFRDAFKAEEDNLKQAHAHMRQATAELASAFAQNPPDPAALQAAEAHLAQARIEANDVVGRIVQAAYTKLSPEGRQRIADLTQGPM
jgi:uncharacterized membrane protein